MGNSAAVLSACKDNDAAHLQTLLGHDAKGVVAAKDQRGDTALHVAITACSADCVKLLLAQQGLDVNARGMEQRTALMHAVYTNEALLKQVLAVEGVDVSAADDRGKTALHHAASRPFAVALLLDRAADPNARDNNGYTPLHTAVVNGEARCVEMLLKKGARVNEETNPVSKTAGGRTPLDIAATDPSRKNCAQILRQHGGVCKGPGSVY